MDLVDTGSPPNAPPEWATRQEEILCPLCSYNLRGLTDSRCPECGHRFEWRALIDASTNRHPYLFEHQPRRNALSFVRTLAAGLRPLRFWAELRPAHRVEVKRLLIYWLLCVACVALLIPVSTLLEQTMGEAAWGARTRGELPATSKGRFGVTYSTPAERQKIVDQWYPLPPDPRFYQRIWLRTTSMLSVRSVWFGKYGLELFWPWTALLAMMIFHESMRLAQVRRVQLMRCLIYCADSVVWYVLATAGVALIGCVALFAVGAERVPWRLFYPVLQYLPLALWLHRTWRLGVAFDKYLGLHRPMLLAIGAQFVQILITAVGMMGLARVLRLL